MGPLWRPAAAAAAAPLRSFWTHILLLWLVGGGGQAVTTTGIQQAAVMADSPAALHGMALLRSVARQEKVRGKTEVGLVEAQSGILMDHLEAHPMARLTGALEETVVSRLTLVFPVVARAGQLVVMVLAPVLVAGVAVVVDCMGVAVAVGLLRVVAAAEAPS